MKPFKIIIQSDETDRLEPLSNALKTVGCQVTRTNIANDPVCVEGEAPDHIDAELLAFAVGISEPGSHKTCIHWGLPETRAETNPLPYEFRTKFELDVFMNGVNESDGWIECEVLDCIKKQYDNEECPDCCESILDDMVREGNCGNCGHVFN